MNLIDHAERFLGKITHGWKDKESDNNLQVVFFQNIPLDAVNTFLTLGLSRHVLNIADLKKVRQELVFPVSGTILPEVVVSFILFIAELILKDHKALLRGEVIQLPREIVGKLYFDAIYCAIPVFLEDDFATFNESEPPTVIVWTIPIYKSEMDFIKTKGWHKFEAILEEKDPDLFSLNRDPVI